MVSGGAEGGQYLDFKLPWLCAVYTRNIIILDIQMCEIFTPINQQLLNNQTLNIWLQGLALMLVQLCKSRPKSILLRSNILKNKNNLSKLKWLLESRGLRDFSHLQESFPLIFRSFTRKQDAAIVEWFGYTVHNIVTLWQNGPTSFSF